MGCFILASWLDDKMPGAMDDSSPDTTDTPDTDTRPSPTAQRGAWLDLITAAKTVGVTERTIQRWASKGELQRRVVNSKAEFWIADDRVGQGDVTPDSTDMPQNAPGAMLAVLDRYEAMIARMNDNARQERDPLIQRIEELATENGRLKAELEAERQRHLISPDSDTRPWWRFW